MLKLISLKNIYFGNFLFLFLFAVLNSIGSDWLKPLFALYAVFCFFAILQFDFSQILFLIISLLFLEGQGRILYEYHPFVRILFDSFLGVSIIKYFIKHKKLFDADKVPRLFLILFALHTLWYLFEVFNIFNLGILAPIAASKVYIFPLIFFFFCLHQEFDFASESFTFLIYTLLALFFMESIISIFQMIGREQLMIKINSYYRKPMGDAFLGLQFRPFGTTHLPGVISVYLFLSCGLFFLKKTFSFWHKSIITMVLLFSTFTVFTSQVRSAIVKYFLLVSLGLFLAFLRSQQKGKNIIISFLTLLSVIFVLVQTPLWNQTQQILQLEKSIERFTSLTDKKTIKNARIDFQTFSNVIEEKLTTHPFGLGPGLTGATQSLSKEAINSDPILNIGQLWAYDNLLVSLVIDFGYGAIFYILILISIPILLSVQAFKAFLKRNYELLNTKLMCLGVVFVILIGNWGAIGLTYNPESFYFWLWSAIGLTYTGQKNEVHAI